MLADPALPPPVKVGVLDTYDWDEAQRYRAELLGVPQKLIPDARKVQAKRDQATQQQQAAQQNQVALIAQAKTAETMAGNMAGA